MSTLINEIRRICEEERVNFQQFMEKIKRKDRPKLQRFPLETVLGDDFECLLSQFSSELPEKMPRNGSAMRVKSLKVLCELLQLQNKKIDRLQDLILTMNEVRQSGR